MSIGENIRKERMLINYTQSKFAEKVGVSQQCVAKWETGKSKPRTELLIKLADMLNCTVDELLREN